MHLNMQKNEINAFQEENSKFVIANLYNKQKMKAEGMVAEIRQNQQKEKLLEMDDQMMLNTGQLDST